jgi:peptide/nickel transport system ATP-binding protein
MNSEILLQVNDISVDYESVTGRVHAVDHVSFTLHRGEIFGLAGESGSGKSTLAFAIARLLRYPAMITGGEVIFHPRYTPGDGEHISDFNVPFNILDLNTEDLRAFRWRKLSIVFQSAMNALNPVMNIHTQIVDVLQVHEPSLSSKERDERAVELLRLVGISSDRLKSYPHQLSGGMRQRAIIAVALALHPELIIMDEPTTALDVVVQREILNELQELQKALDLSIIFITHDLSLLLEISDVVAIMYAGKIAETGTKSDFASHPKHPYTYGLLHSFPSLYGEKQQMVGIPGHPPDLRELPTGCLFHPRCSFASDTCRRQEPKLAVPDATRQHQQVACHLYDRALHPEGPPASVDPTQARLTQSQSLPTGGHTDE